MIKELQIAALLIINVICFAAIFVMAMFSTIIAIQMACIVYIISFALFQTLVNIYYIFTFIKWHNKLCDE